MRISITFSIILSPFFLSLISLANPLRMLCLFCLIIRDPNQQINVCWLCRFFKILKRFLSLFANKVYKYFMFFPKQFQEETMNWLLLHSEEYCWLNLHANFTVGNLPILVDIVTFISSFARLRCKSSLFYLR